MPGANDDYAIVVAGGGLAGLTAGLFAARHGHATLVLAGGTIGGPLASVEKIEDYPGFPEGIAGYELGPLVQEQAANQGADFRLAELERLEARDDGWLVTASDSAYQARAVIIATGSRPRELGLPGEERLRGKGLSHCASCDGPLLRGRVVGVVGGGDSACQEALTLADYAAEVVLFHRRATLTAQQALRERVGAQSRIVSCPNTILEEILGDTKVTGVRARDTVTGATAQVDLAALFIYIGLAPHTAVLQDLLTLDDAGRVPTDAWMRTTRPGLFAAGDIRSDSAAQAITAAGDGATAAIAAHRYLTQRA